MYFSVNFGLQNLDEFVVGVKLDATDTIKNLLNKFIRLSVTTGKQKKKKVVFFFHFLKTFLKLFSFLLFATVMFD